MDKSEYTKELSELVSYINDIWQFVPVPLVYTSPLGVVFDVDSAFENMSNMKKDDVIGQFVVEMFESQAKIKKLLEETIKTGKAFCEECRLKANQGKTVPVTVSTVARKDRKGETIGIFLALIDKTERNQTETVLRQSYEKLQKTMESAVEAMSRVIETRDPYTAGHQRRVAELAKAISEIMGLSESETQGIHMASLIHDIGKLYLPAEILVKPIALSDLEFQMVKTHSAVGYDIVKTIAFPWPVATIILQHHERIDGSGYPNGLKGSEILLEARILAVADVVEAMSSNRPYRPARPIEESLNEIDKNQNILYDAPVVAACLDLFRNRRFKFTISERPR